MVLNGQTVRRETTSPAAAARTADSIDLPSCPGRSWCHHVLISAQRSSVPVSRASSTASHAPAVRQRRATKRLGRRTPRGGFPLGSEGGCAEEACTCTGTGPRRAAHPVILRRLGHFRPVAFGQPTPGIRQPMPGITGRAAGNRCGMTAPPVPEPTPPAPIPPQPLPPAPDPAPPPDPPIPTPDPPDPIPPWPPGADSSE